MLVGPIQDLFQSAIRAHQAGRLREAEALYRQVLYTKPDHPDALHLLGVMALELGRPEASVNLITRALALDPSSPVYHRNLGQALAASGRPDEAIASLRRALDLSQRSQPLPAELVQLLLDLGNALRANGELSGAIERYQQALLHEPTSVPVHNNLGQTLREAGRTREALVHLQLALQHAPLEDVISRVAAHNNLAGALRELKQFDKALEEYQKALNLAPNDPNLYNNLGLALRENERIDEAIRAHTKAIHLGPEQAEFHNALGVALNWSKRFSEAIYSFEQSIRLRPEYGLAHVGLGLALIQQGDFARAWPHYEWRMHANELADSFAEIKGIEWRGSQLDGQRILIHVEQGFGDLIQFARFIPLVANKGGKVILRCYRELIRLLQSMSGIDRVVSTGDPLPDYDAYCWLHSLGGIFNVTLASLPGPVPYLHADLALCASWRDRIRNDHLRVGLVWAGRAGHTLDQKRSVQLEMLTPLAAAAQTATHFYSLQKGPAAKQAQHPPLGMQLSDWSDELVDFADTAALIENLDLVITVDTAVAHLGGALGKPVWVLLPYNSDWRWMADREDSPWYPTMRLFRQPISGDWETPIQRVAKALRSFKPLKRDST